MLRQRATWVSLQRFEPELEKVWLFWVGAHTRRSQRPIDFRGRGGDSGKPDVGPLVLGLGFQGIMG